MKKLFICIQGTLKPNCIGEKVILKSCIQNYISLEDTYDLNTLRQHVVETQFSKVQQEDYTFVVISLTLIS